MVEDIGDEVQQISSEKVIRVLQEGYESRFENSKLRVQNIPSWSLISEISAWKI